MDGGPNHRNKAAFSNCSGAVWTGPKVRISLGNCLDERLSLCLCMSAYAYA